ncbi:MAG: hypothetical protein NZL89_06175, partial [Leptospiraceae bacterium]|nr:hypothetical protein [Leptospiraceae bacterium]
VELNSDQIEVIRLELGDRHALLGSNLRSLIDYADRAGIHLARTIQSGGALSEKDQEDLAAGGAFIAESLQTLQNYFHVTNKEALAEAIRQFNQNTDLVEKINALALIQNQLKLWLRQLEFAQVSPAQAEEKIQQLRERQSEFDAELEKIAAKFSQGREHEALELLESVTQTLIDAALFIQIANPERSESIEKLIELLNQLAAAMDAHDLVTAADLVDFDLRDLLRELCR